ncbi:MAG: DUF411 domain-containing protein [Magnetococcus sp. MYC-9]
MNHLPISSHPARSDRLPWLVGLATLLSIGMGWSFMQASEKPVPITVFKSPSCECCTAWIQHLTRHGFAVTVENREDMMAVKRTLGVPDGMASCHTGVVDGYVVEGHLPAGDIHRLLRERPSVLGIGVPGMPIGSPGMELPGAKPEPYVVFAFGQDGRSQPFANH